MSWARLRPASYGHIGAARLVGAGCCLLLSATAASPQPLSDTLASRLQGPAPPIAPEVVTRDPDGRATVRATRVRDPLELDGRLDEPFYDSVQFITDFVQQLPDEGAAGSERTEAWILFDDDNIYISARCYDRAPTSQWVANEMRRDVIQLRNNDSFSVMLDAFYDRRNGLAFLVTPIGGFSDFAITNEGGSVNSDWNTIWDSRTGLRRWVDGGDAYSIQVAALPSNRRTALGHPATPHHPAPHRGVVFDAPADLGRPRQQRYCRAVAGI
jgi:hypothetical protein